LRSPTANTAAGEEIGGQVGGDLPLCGRGVLHLVEQQMVQPAVELEQHPGGAAGIFEQGGGASDQIVVIQQPAPVPCLRHAAEDRPRGG
jgi:hypothetical protein